MNTEKPVIIYAIIAVILMLIIGFIPMKAHAQTLDMSFGQVTNMNVYRMKIQISEDITYKWLTVTPYGGWTTWSQWDSNHINGDPFRDTYDIGIKATFFDSWYIDVNHFCSHNVISPRKDAETTLIDINSGKTYHAYENPKWIPAKTWDNSLTVVSIGYHKSFSSWNLN